MKFLSLATVLAILVIVCCFTVPAKGRIRCDKHCASGCKRRGPGKCDRYCRPYATWRLRVFDHTCQPRCGGHCLYCKSYFWCDVCWLRGYRLKLRNGGRERICCLKTNPKCACDPNCVSGCKIAGQCDVLCRTGFYLVDKKCVPAPECDDNCIGTCDVGAGKCDADCDTNYMLETATNFCAMCDAYCVPATPGSCTSPGTCDTSCVTPYGLNPIIEQCQECPEGCATCADPMVGCTTCETGRINSPPDCPGCQAECIVLCQTAGMCDPALPAITQCIDGYGPSPIAAPVICGLCDPNCKPDPGCKVKGAGLCDSDCNPGYVLTAAFQCAECQTPNPEKCALCTNPGTCDVCVSPTDPPTDPPPDPVAGICA